MEHFERILADYHEEYPDVPVVLEDVRVYRDRAMYHLWISNGTRHTSVEVSHRDLLKGRASESTLAEALRRFGAAGRKILSRERRKL